MDILSPLPDTAAGRHTQWLWSRMLAMARGAPPPESGELAEHLAPSVFEEVSAERLVELITQIAPIMPLVTQLVEVASSEQRYTALLRLPTSWLRYTCHTQDEEPRLVVAFGYPRALDPNTYSDQRVKRDGRDVQIRDFGGAGPLMLLWHGAGCDLTIWETLVPHLAGLRVVAQDLPGHGRSPSKMFTMSEALLDADAVVAKLDLGPPIIVGHSLGGYLGLRYAATRKCSGWIGFDGPFGVVYPWSQDDAGLPEMARRIGREIRGINVVNDLAATSCPMMMMLCATAASPVEEPMMASRRELAEHIARHHPEIRIEWVQTGHDTIVFDQLQETATKIRDFLLSWGGTRASRL